MGTKNAMIIVGSCIFIGLGASILFDASNRPTPNELTTSRRTSEVKIYCITSNEVMFDGYGNNFQRVGNGIKFTDTKTAENVLITHTACKVTSLIKE